MTTKNSCQCRWYSCNADHGVSDNCQQPATGVWTHPVTGEKLALCNDCHEGDGEIPDNEWSRFR